MPADDTVIRTRARRAVRHLAPGNGTPDIVVRADPVGSANLMREIVALHGVDVALEERDGHWQVVVRAGEDHEAVLVQVIDVTARCVERGRMKCATLYVGRKSYTIHEPLAPALELPAEVA